MSKEDKQFAAISWCADDVRELVPQWSVDRCELYLERNEDRIQQALLAAGWGVLRSDLLGRDHNG